jgi:hypothetical protein
MTALDNKDVGFCYLKDQKPLSPQAFEKALKLREQIRGLCGNRLEFIRQARLDPDIHLPHGNWEMDSGLYAAYRTVAGGDYAILNNLRLFSQIFTGFQLLSLSPARDLPIPQEVPHGLDRRLALRAASASPDIQYYLDLTGHLPEALHITPPRIFGEIGWVVNGKLINHDTNVYLERLALLAESGKLWELRNRNQVKAGAGRPPAERPRILEIGGGYGGLAHYLMQLIPQARYVIVDIPESLLFSSIYLSTLWPDKDNLLLTPDDPGKPGETAGFTFVPNFLFDRCRTLYSEFDLVINTLSLSEMNQEQIRYYCAGIKELLGKRGVFFEQNQDNRPVGMLDAKSIIAECLPWQVPLRSCVVPATQGQANLWAGHQVPPYAWRPAANAVAGSLTAIDEGEPPLLMEEGYCGVNVIYYRGGWYGLPQGCGPFDPDRVARRDYPKLFTSDSKNHLKEMIHSWRAPTAGKRG